jgi:glycosyltransferase involved in cell wall biosynthesis
MPGPSNQLAAPHVTAVVATRDRPELLARAVAAILDQHYPGPIECIVVFDQSTPAPITVDVPDGRVLRSVTNSRTPGLAGARNTGILAAAGELVGFCDDDDEWLPDKIRRQVEVLGATDGAAVVGCALVLDQGTQQSVARAPMDPVTIADLTRSRVWELHPSTVLARLSAVHDRIGLVDEAIPGSYAEDYEWLLRAAAVAPIPMAPEPLVRVRWHPQSFFAKRWQMIADALTYLLEKHPELGRDRRGLSRITGQIAFAQAASRHGRCARRSAVRSIRGNWREGRGYLALLVSFRLLSPDLVLRVAHAHGKGI